MKEIPLTQGQVAFVDDEDFEWLSQWKWYAKKGSPSVFYAARSDYATKKTVLMHKAILGIEGSEVCGDHIDGDGLNNQRLNLRVATKSQNCINRPHNTNNKVGVKGVNLEKGTSKYRVQIMANGKKMYLGLYDTLEEAAEVRRKAEELHHGHFARNT